MDGQFSHGLMVCEKLFQAYSVVEPEKKEMTVDEFLEYFEKKKARVLTSNLSTYTMRGKR